MNKLLNVTLFFALFCMASSVLAVNREYWVAAEIVEWDYIPSGVNNVDPDRGVSPWGDTSTYVKYRYVEYTDGNFDTKKCQPKWMGILGPQLRAVEGDTLIVHFLNRADKPLTMHPHGVKYTQANEGSSFPITGEPGSKVDPGDSYTYVWHADAQSAPIDDQTSSLVWLYHSNFTPEGEIYEGLVGTIVVTKAGANRSVNDPRPRDVDHEFTTFFMVFNEESDAEEGLMHAMNGYLFANLEGYTAYVGEKIRWHLVALGTEVDLHTAHWHGNTVVFNEARTDVIELLPASMKSVDMEARSAGNWAYHCHVEDHIAAGMFAFYQVLPRT